MVANFRDLLGSYAQLLSSCDCDLLLIEHFDYKAKTSAVSPSAIDNLSLPINTCPSAHPSQVRNQQAVVSALLG